MNNLQYYDHYSFTYDPNNFSSRNIFLISIGSSTAIFNILLILLILIHKHRFWISYWNYLLSMLFSATCFAIVGLPLEVNTVDGLKTDSRTMGSFLCKMWYFSCGTLFDGFLLSLSLINIDRAVSLFSPKKYASRSYENGSKLALALIWATLILINISLAFSFDQYAHFLPSTPCIHLMKYRNRLLDLIWAGMHFISSVTLIIAIAFKSKDFPPNEIENKTTGCVLAILLLDFFVTFSRFAPGIALYVSSGHQEITDLMFLVEWSSQLLPPLFWLLDSNIRKSIKMLFCEQCGMKQKKSVNLVEESQR